MNWKEHAWCRYDAGCYEEGPCNADRAKMIAEGERLQADRDDNVRRRTTLEAEVKAAWDAYADQVQENITLTTKNTRLEELLAGIRETLGVSKPVLERWAKGLGAPHPEMLKGLALQEEYVKLSEEKEKLKELWKLVRYTPGLVDNSTAAWTGAYMNFERVMDEATGITLEGVRTANLEDKK